MPADGPSCALSFRVLVCDYKRHSHPPAATLELRVRDALPSHIAESLRLLFFAGQDANSIMQVNHQSLLFV